MKLIFTFLLSLSISVAISQNQMFVHTATAGTISADLSLIDHPDLNGNPNAKLLVSHNWNPPGSVGIYNDNNTGLYYSAGDSKWGVYNENALSIIEDSSYNVYIAQGSEVFLHIADLANQGSSDAYSVINHPDLNNNPNANIILTTYYNPNSLRNDHTYGVWYDDIAGRWNIYSEDFATIPLDSAFFVGVSGGLGVSVKHQANAGNISSNWTVIDHPLLNGNPNAVFTFTHNWGTTGEPANVVVDNILGAWYTGTNWAIYIEDGATAFPVDAEFDLFIYDPSLGITENILEKVVAYPNPVVSQLNIESSDMITQIEIFNILGQQVLTIEGNSNKMNIDVSSLTAGTYMARVTSGNASKTIKLIKV
jgi:hypothetical protein